MWQVVGRRWRTPLELTAESLTVDIGEMVIDYNRLMWQQTVALKNVPKARMPGGQPCDWGCL